MNDRPLRGFSRKIGGQIVLMTESLQTCAYQFLPHDHELLFTQTLRFSRAGSNTIQDPHFNFAVIYWQLLDGVEEPNGLILLLM